MANNSNSNGINNTPEGLAATARIAVIVTDLIEESEEESEVAVHEAADAEEYAALVDFLYPRADYTEYPEEGHRFHTPSWGVEVRRPS